MRPEKAFCTLLIAFISFHSPAQKVDSTGPLVLTEIDTWKLQSDIIGEEYTIYVLRHENYDTTNNRLPVLYVTDGDWNMTVAKNCFSMLRQDYTTHEPLVVGIGYGNNQNKRGRDLDPATGGPKFLEFIEKEVMPFVDKRYRTNNERAVYGYSMGGMFTTYILFNRADLFQKIFIGAPGNNGRDLMPAARAYFSKNKDLKSKVFVGVGSFENETSKNIDSFTTYLAAKKLAGLEVNSVFTPDAGHGAALAQVMQNAIAFGYCDKHKRIAVNPSSFKNLEGKYTFYQNDTAMAVAKVYTKAGKLYILFDGQHALPEELIAFGTNQFFLPANEKSSFIFKEKELIVSVANDKDYRLIKQ